VILTDAAGLFSFPGIPIGPYRLEVMLPGFRTSVQTGIDIIKALRGHTSGMAVPTFVVDAPGGGGKLPVSPDYVVGREGDDLVLTNFENKLFRYPDPGGRLGRVE